MNNSVKRLMILMVMGLALCGCNKYSNELNNKVITDINQLTKERIDEYNDKLSLNTENKVIKVSKIEMKVVNVNETIERIESITKNYNAIISENSIALVENKKESYKAKLSVKIEEDEIYKYISEIKGLEVQIINVDIISQDISKEYIDYSSQIRAKEIEEERIMSLIKESKSLDDILKMEEKLTSLRSEIDYMKNSVKEWENMDEKSTLNIDIKDGLSIYENHTGMERLKLSFNSGVENIVYILSLILENLFTIIFLVLMIFLFLKHYFKKQKIE